jgi:xylan 1,4-beta-xylosidase
MNASSPRSVIRNPILPGFNPDPSIVRVGGDYYIATSTFEWYPGVQIHHSRDLVNWRLAARPLDRPSQLDLRGEPDSCGVWAPCLTHADGKFWLVYTDMKRKSGSFRDCHNYLVTAPAIDGPWSEPVFLNSSGFDPSLFHDDDGRKWLVNMLSDYRARPSRFAGIVIQEFDPAAGRLAGPVTTIFKGSRLGWTEGPHLYKRGGFYHLLVAEGGTGYEHAASMARSASLLGPYELHPDVAVVTSRYAPDASLQRSGHGDLVETAEGETYLVHLASRPLPGLRRSPLGRETAIQKCVWGEDGWLRLEGEKYTPMDRVAAPDLPSYPFPPEPERTDFMPGKLPMPFQWLRTPHPERLFSLSERPGFLRLYGRESVGSWYEQALVARRQTGFDYDAETEVMARPGNFMQMAGLIAYYNRSSYHYLALTWDDAAGVCLQVITCNGEWPTAATYLALEEPVAIAPDRPVGMRIETRGATLRFHWSQEGGPWRRIGPVLDASVLSDECGEGQNTRSPASFTGVGNFTGAFVGMAANDVSGLAMPADFSHFSYRNLSEG